MRVMRCMAHQAILMEKRREWAPPAPAPAEGRGCAVNKLLHPGPPKMAQTEGSTRARSRMSQP